MYHQRWDIEEAFQRIKSRLSLEHVSGERDSPKAINVWAVGTLYIMQRVFRARSKTG
jgi:IS4 transposase